MTDETTPVAKSWYQSKTKVGAALLGFSAFITTIASVVSGSLTWTSAVTDIVAEIGTITLAFGIRNWPILNGGK